MEPNRSILEFSALSTVLLANDLQHLLAIMSACADSLARRPPYDSAERDIADLRDAIGSASQLSRELLAAVGLQQAAERTVIDLHEVIVRYRGAMSRLIGENVRLVINLEPGSASIQAAPVQIEWVLLHLLANARDAMPSGGVIYLDTARIGSWRGPVEAPRLDERYVELTVRDHDDDGDDLEVEPLEPFFTTRHGAVGLGLASVAATVRALKGWSYVERHQPAGRTVHVLLPLYAGHHDTDAHLRTELPDS
jgi:signal transduction histidine kinase